MSGFLSSISNGELTAGEYRPKRTKIAFTEVRKTAQEIGSNVACNIQTALCLEVNFKAQMFMNSSARGSDRYVKTRQILERELREHVYGEVVSELLSLRRTVLDELGGCESADAICNEICELIKKLRGE